ncbi:telomere-associated protein RIF1 isoform X1 [Corythoichthys intestinalis]|uniref:telomere-associated protein RIF1 isoform X1 n=1 Tax=Corythoichthys intestinalis TaxID=161448 RepID=UPI0025A53945|nr:telomere-associated protein RIF1 isoform X1 [Corythoichthys intestinalis]XP_057708054.1 telomere-associated protein RIF1 isoform X1 [Corythoichthys intestinalis]
MMVSVEPPSFFSIVPLLECLEDSEAGRPEKTDAYLTIANRLSGEEGRKFLPAVTKHFPRLGNAILSHVSSPHAELSQAALQALGFCVYHSHVISGVSETLTTEILSALCTVVSKSAEKNTCTRALWVIAKQNFPADVVGEKVPSLLSMLESVWSKGEVQSVVMEHEALNVIIRLLEQVPSQMGEQAVCWAKLVVPLVVHSASKVRLKAAAAMEMGLPLMLQKQIEVAAFVEPLLSTKLIREMEKLFMSKNETNVLKLWPLFVKLLGKLLHRGGPFINSLLHLEELGFRSSSPNIKKIAFIAWKSLIDNFALNPEILCSSKRMKLLMQPLMSINIRSEALMLTKVEVWWYLVVQLGPNLSSFFDLVSVPLLQCTIGSDVALAPATPARGQNGVATPSTHKTTGPASFNNLTPNTPRLGLNSSMQLSTSFHSIKLLGLEMLLHYFLGPEVVATATKSKIVLALEPLRHPLLNAASSFSKHAAVLISSIKDGFVVVGKEAPDALLALLWDHLIRCVSLTIESGSKKERHGCEVLTMTLQALQNVICSEALPADKVLILLESTVRGISPRVLGSASYQVGKMDVLNGTPALFLILLLIDSSMLAIYVEDARFYQCLQTLVECSLSGPTSPLAFAEAVLGAIGRSATSVQSKEHLLRMWSAVVAPLTEIITQSNEVNQGDALEHNFNAMHSALMFPVTHLLGGSPQQQGAQKSMLSTWSKLYKVFARCSALVVTAEENVCCEELCLKMVTAVDRDALKVPSTLSAITCILQVMVECVDFSPYMPQFQQKLKSPHTPVNWSRKRSKALGNLSTFQSLLIQCLDVYLAEEDVPSETTGVALFSVLSTLFTNLLLANAIKEALTSLISPLVGLYKQAACEPPRFTTAILTKMEKLLGEVFGSFQSCTTLASDNDLLALLSPLLCVLFPHKNKQHRTAVTQFWNSTFAKAVGLIYPDELRPVLSQVKQKIPIILPGFETVSSADELSGQYSSEGSQLETKLSGIPIASTGKRDSHPTEQNERSYSGTPKLVSTKLDFGSPNVPRQKVLDEEASVDFVFIPPETKERVLTEHQKEVKRTKRVDIPAMYNNLDASLDSTVFTQYTQSQEEPLSKLPPEEADKVTGEAPTEIPQDTLSNEVADICTQKTPDLPSPKVLENESRKEEQEMIPESTDISVEEEARTNGRGENMDTQNENVSPNISNSSDLISGTPQKSSGGSRRQSFITLEKYTEGKPVSPSNVFTGPVVKTSSRQDSTPPSPEASQKPTDENVQLSSQALSKCSVSDLQESPQRPKMDRERNAQPVKLTERLTRTETEDNDVIPDTQTEDVFMENTPTTSTTEEVRSSDLDRDSPAWQKRCKKAKLAPEERPVDSSTPLNRPNTRSKVASEEDMRRIRLRSHGDRSHSSQDKSPVQSHRKVRLFNSSKDFLSEPENKRKNTKSQESSQTDMSESESQPKKKGGRPRKVLSETDDHTKPKKTLSSTDFKSGSQSDSESQSQQLQSVTGSNLDSQPRRKPGRPQRSQLMSKRSSQAGICHDAQVDSKGNSQNDCSQVSNKLQDPNAGDLKKPESMSEKICSQTDIIPLDTQADLESHSQENHERSSKSIESKNEHAQSPEKIFKQTDTQADCKSPGRDDLSAKSLLEPKEEDLMNPAIISGKASGQILLKPDVLFDSDSQTHRSSSGISKSLSESEEGLEPESMSSQTDSQSDTKTDTESHTQRKRGRHSKLLSEVLEVNNSQAQGCEMALSSSETDRQSQEIELVEKAKDSQIIAPLTGDLIQERISMPDFIIGDQVEVDKDEPEAELTPTSADSPYLEPGKRNKAFSETAQESEPKALFRNQSMSHSQENSQADDRGRTRRSKVNKHQSNNSSTSTPESSQSLDVTGSTESSQGRRSKRRSSKALTASTESLESEIVETREKHSLPTKRLKAQGMSPSPLTERFSNIDCTAAKNNSEGPEILESAEVQKHPTDLTVPEAPEPFQKTQEPETPKKQISLSSSPSKKQSEQQISQTKANSASASQERDSRELDSSEKSESEVPLTNQTQKDQSSEAFASNTQTPPKEAKENLQDPESTLQKPTPVVVGPKTECTTVCKDDTVVPVEDTQCSALAQKQEECSSVGDELSKAPETSITNIPEKSHQVLEELIPLHDGVEDENISIREFKDGERTPMLNVQNNSEASQSDVCINETTKSDISQDSPAKFNDMEAALMSDMVQSPCSNMTKVTWSPSASPSTSILKKAQKRPLEEETPSPVVKSRRVSFANPIQHQETADDIDRRSPALRTSSPRRAKVSNLPKPKFVTTPTKGVLTISPRNLHSPNFRSSKKCLMTEMSQEPHPVSKDCIYPALVGCNAPVEDILPQISSRILLVQSRGFGQLVRARNIKTIGNLSALTPQEIKTLPIYPPKISNVKKALKTYEQQRKGRGVDELKSFVEMEMMTSELEESSVALNQDEDEKPGGTLATEMTEEPAPTQLEEERPEATPDSSVSQAPEDTPGDPEGLMGRLDDLDKAVTPPLLSLCSPHQLFDIHERVRLLMSRVMTEMQNRFAPVDTCP